MWSSQTQHWWPVLKAKKIRPQALHSSEAASATHRSHTPVAQNCTHTSAIPQKATRWLQTLVEKTQTHTEKTPLHIASGRCPPQTYRPTICTWSQNWSFQPPLSKTHTQRCWHFTRVMSFLSVLFRNEHTSPFTFAVFLSHSKMHAMSEHLPKLEECEAAVMTQIIGPLVRQTILSTEPCRHLCPSWNHSSQLAKLGLPWTISRIICPMSLIITSCFLMPYLHSPRANSSLVTKQHCRTSSLLKSVPRVKKQLPWSVDFRVFHLFIFGYLVLDI